MELDISTERDGAKCRITVGGEVDVYTSPQLKSHIVDAVDAGCIDLVVDLEGVTFIDSSGLGVLMSGLRRAKEQDGSMHIVCTRESILKILRITGLDKVFPIFSSVDDAEGF